MTEKVKIFALSTCPYCKKTKRFMSENGIEYDAIDVDLLTGKEQDELLKEIEKLTGRRSFPVVVIGDEVIVGHNEEQLRKVLQL